MGTIAQKQNGKRTLFNRSFLRLVKIETVSNAQISI